MEQTARSKEKVLEEIQNLIREYYTYRKFKFEPGKSKVGYSAANVDEKEAIAATQALLNGWGTWLAEGKYADEFEKDFARYIGTADCVVTNSGSSSLYLAMRTLMNPLVPNHMKPGDEVITPALTFPTSLNSIILNNLTPVLVDVEMKTACMDMAKLEKLIGPKTRAILVLHHLGASPDMRKVQELAKKYNLFIVEDSCDGHGSTYDGKRTGSLGDMGCFSFYSAHQMTMGEGGAITTNSKLYASILRSLKACGKACFCAWDEPRPDLGACRARFNFKLGNDFADHRFVTSNIGSKMKIIDIQAAIGIEQLKKLPHFVEQRKKNYRIFANHMKKYNKYLHVVEPGDHSDPCWFAVPFAVQENAPFDRRAIASYLESKMIETRPLLGGNMELQPAYKSITFKKSDMTVTNFFHKRGLFIGCNPALSEDMIEYVCTSIDEFFATNNLRC